jgi:hypothetical protein
MEIKKGNLNFDQTGRAYPDNPHLEENWNCIWEDEGKYYKLVGDINNKEWEEVQLGEDPKEEKLNEAADKWVFETNGHKWSNNDDTAGDNYGSFKAGAEWQAKTMYSKEAVEEMFATLKRNSVDNIATIHNIDLFIESWTREFKK